MLGHKFHHDHATYRFQVRQDRKRVVRRRVFITFGLTLSTGLGVMAAMLPSEALGHSAMVSGLITNFIWVWE